MLRKGTYPHPTTYPLVPGFEISGRVALIGPGVEGVKEGDRVAAYVEHGGGYAELCVTDAEGLIRLPDAVRLDAACAFPIQGLTSWHMIHTLGGTKPGDAVLIHAIGGGVGLFCTQIAVHAGARVIGTVGTPGKERRALELGAERVVDRGKEDFVAVALAMTGGRGVDLVIDSLGATTLDRSFEAVRKLGKVVNIGEAEGDPFKNIRERLLPRSLTFTRFHLGHVDRGSPLWQASVEAMLEGIVQGWLEVPIERVFAFDHAQRMNEALESRRVSGKLLLELGG
jgi:NADPH2:quinone reductase